MVSWSGGEVQLLLTLVKEREALYDVANDDYTNRDIVWALWTDIARQLNKTPTACRDKWTSLRCVYRRIINQQTTSKTKRKIKWPWANLMTFLIPHLKTVQPRYGPDIEINDDDSVITINDHKMYDTNQETHYLSLNEEDYEVEEALGSAEDGIAEYLYEECAESETGEEQSSTVSSVKRVKLEPSKQNKSRTGCHSKQRNENMDEFVKLVQTPTYSVQKAASSPPPSVMQDTLSGADADEMFFRSIVPDVKLLNHKDKAIFKLKVQQLLFDMLYPVDQGIQYKDAYELSTVT